MQDLTVILAAGDYPAPNTEPHRLLRMAQRVVSCDSAAEKYFRDFGFWPAVIVGDLDSLHAAISPEAGVTVVRIREQQSNDLVKAIRYCHQREWRNLVIVGATGLREDHTIGNVFSVIGLGIRIVTEHGEFHPFAAAGLRLRMFPNGGISIFSSSPRAHMTSRGLKWNLSRVKFSSPAVAILNRARSSWVTLTSTQPAYAYVAREKAARRVIVSLGSNLGNRERNLAKARAALARLPQTIWLDASAIHETEGVDVPKPFADLKFLNQIVLLETCLEPLDFSREIHAIEDRLGRVRTVKNGPRTIDLDLIDFGGITLKTPELTLPHPRSGVRTFVTEPLRELGIETKCRDKKSHNWLFES